VAWHLPRIFHLFYSDCAFRDSIEGVPKTQGIRSSGLNLTLDPVDFWLDLECTRNGLFRYGIRISLNA
jgi:hypothetical protein